MSTGEFADEVWGRLSSAVGIRWRSEQANEIELIFGGHEQGCLLSWSLTRVNTMLSDLEIMDSKV